MGDGFFFLNEKYERLRFIPIWVKIFVKRRIYVRYLTMNSPFVADVGIADVFVPE